MNPYLFRMLGLLGGLLLLFLAITQFLKSYRAGTPKWNYIVMVCGMGLILYYTIFRKKN